MANTSQEQALYEMSQILREDPKARDSFNQHVTQIHFGHLRGRGMHVGPWRTNPNGDITCIELMTSPFLQGNLRRAVLNEALGIGPKRYCVYYQPRPEFFQRLQYLMVNLPRRKMFLYGEDIRLGGPFLQEPWLTRGQELLAQPSISAQTFHDYFVAPY